MRAGMYFCTFDRDENMLSFEFNEETRQMLGYDGLEDLPNEFDSWVKTLVPEEREAIGKVFNFSIFIDVNDMSYRMISTNEYVEMVPKDPDSFKFLKNNVALSVAESFRADLYEWLDKDKILAAIEEHGILQ